MKAITLTQPWASLMADGKKSIDTRSWYTPYRGSLAIHAGKKVDRKACIEFGYDPDSIPAGCVVAIGILVDCKKFPEPSMPEDPYGDFSPGRYGFRISKIRKLESPISYKGSLGLWNWPER